MTDVAAVVVAVVAADATSFDVETTPFVAAAVADAELLSFELETLVAWGKYSWPYCYRSSDHS